MWSAETRNLTFSSLRRVRLTLVTDGVRANIEGAGAGAQARVVLNMASTDELFESVEVGKPAKSMELEIEEQDIEGASDEQGVRALGQTEATTVIAKKNKEVSPGKAGAKNETNEKVTRKRLGSAGASLGPHASGSLFSRSAACGGYRRQHRGARPRL